MIERNSKIRELTPFEIGEISGGSDTATRLRQLWNRYHRRIGNGDEAGAVIMLNRIRALTPNQKRMRKGAYTNLKPA